MPSHIVHRVVGERICGFSSEEIDRLVDAPEHHDASRYFCSHLLTHAKLVLSAFGDKGLCYLALHHYLDKFTNIVYGRVWHYGKFKTMIDPVTVAQRVLEGLESSMLRGFEDEISVFKALELVIYGLRARLEELRLKLDGGFQEALLEHKVKEYFESLGYSKSTAKKKARQFIETLKNCLTALQSLSPGDVELLRKVADVARDVRRKIANNARWILCTMMQLDPEYTCRSLGVLADAITQLCSKS
jgi:hypothetical protein